MYDLFIQAIGFIALALFISSYQVKSNRGLFLLQTIGNLLFCLQFILLGGIGGAVSSFICSTRNFILILGNKKPFFKKKFWAVLICICSLCSCLYSWESFLSILPFLSVLTSTIGYWSDNALKIRMMNLLFASPCWLIYDVSIHSLGGVLNELMTISSVLISIYRFGFRSMGENRFDGKQDEK